jgi:hypothetical protein
MILNWMVAKNQKWKNKMVQLPSIASSVTLHYEERSKVVTVTWSEPA